MYDLFYMMLYAVATATAVIASCYLLFRRGNAFAPDITPPVRLRRWTAAFFAAIALCHVWYLPTYFLTSPDDMMLGYLIAGLIDFMTVVPLTVVVLLTMLQDRRRPLWPVAVMVAPLVVGLAWCVAVRSFAIQPVLYAYFLLMSLGLIVYMLRAIMQYGRWLRDNYADLEHKEVWQGFVMLTIILLAYAIYVLDVGEPLYEYAMEVINIVLVCYLLWRVETLTDLNSDTANAAYDVAEETVASENVEESDPLSMRNNIGPLLKQYCEESKLYLEHDVSLSQLASLIGINRSYLSRHFAKQGMTYNTYINGLRIQHFMELYHNVVATHQPITVRQLAHQSGFRSYSTFNAAFKLCMGMTATEWMRDMAEQ